MVKLAHWKRSGRPPLNFATPRIAPKIAGDALHRSKTRKPMSALAINLETIGRRIGSKSKIRMRQR